MKIEGYDMKMIKHLLKNKTDPSPRDPDLNDLTLEAQQEAR